MDGVTGVTGVAGVISSLKATKELISAVQQGHAEAKAYELAISSNKEIYEIQEALIRIQDEMYQLRLKNREQQDKILELQEINCKRGEYELFPTEAGSTILKWKNTPSHYACPTCATKTDKFYVLQPTHNSTHNQMCMECGSNYMVTKDNTNPHVPEVRRSWNRR